MSSDGRTTVALEAPAAPMRVIVAEDDTELRGTMSRDLGALGHVVVGEVATVADVIDRTRELIPDVLLLDAHLGPNKMVEIVQTLARETPSVAVIFLSGEPTFALEGDDTGTAAICVLPSSSPPQVMDATIRLAAHRTRELCIARAELAEARKQLENRKTIERAKGLLMRRTGLSEQEAYRILQRTSQDRSVPMVDVAREVLESEPGRQQEAR